MLDERTLVDASVTYTGGDGAWFVRAFGNNLTDETYRIASQVVAGLWTHSQFGAPRNYRREGAVCAKCFICYGFVTASDCRSPRPPGEENNSCVDTRWRSTWPGRSRSPSTPSPPP